MSEGSVAALLGRETLRAFERRELHAALGHPWAWPADPREAQRALALGLTPPAPPPVGDVLLLSYTHGAPPRGGLARLSRERAHGGALGLGPTAQRSLQLATGLVTYDLSALLRPEALVRRETWQASLLHGGPRNLQLLDGDSFGLAFAIAAASLLADAPAPSDLAASAVLRPDGSLAPVDGLPTKVRVLRENALGVRRLMVAPEQVEEARAAAGAGLEVLGVQRLEEALALLFPSLGEAPPERWRDPWEAGSAARQLFHLARRPKAPVLGWKGVESAAASLLAALPADDEAGRARATFARQVARRHMGRAAPMEWPGDEALRALPAPIRLGVLSHVLQAATDAGVPDLADWLERARPWMPALHESEIEGLSLWGARGRGLARLRRYDEAARLLEDVFDAWLDAQLAEQSTFALSELLRVHGIRGDAAALEALTRAVSYVLAAPLLAETSRAYVRLAQARAHVEVALAGGAEADLRRELPVLMALADSDEGTTPRHVALGSLRTAARASAALGDGATAAHLRARLASERFPAAVLLGRLDAAVESGTGIAEALRGLASYRHHLALLEDGAGSTSELAVRIVREYPY